MSYADNIKTSSLLENIYSKMNEQYLLKVGQRDQLLREKASLTELINRNKEIMEIKEKVAVLLRMSGEYAREQAKVGLEIMVTNALQFILQEDIEFKISFDIKRGRPEAVFYIVSHYDVDVETEPEDERGGGIVDIISTTLRIAIMQCFNVDGPLFLDEPAKHLSKMYMPAFAEFLKRVAEEFDRQIVIVTHNPTLAECGEMTYHVVKKYGTSHVMLIDKSSTDIYDLTPEERNEKEVELDKYVEENINEALESLNNSL